MYGVATALAQDDVLGVGLPLPDHVGSLAAEVVHESGVVKVDRVLSKETAAALLEFVQTEFLRALDSAASDPLVAADLFSRGIYQPKNGRNALQTRWDFRLALAPIVRQALREMLRGAIGDAFSSLAGGLEAELWELAALISAPGSAPQAVHSDTTFCAQPSLFTALVALQDVESDMGPTRFLPGTHTAEHHASYEVDPASFVQANESMVALLDAGDASLFDSRLLHCGSANKSHRQRVLLTVTFRHVNAPEWLDALDRSMRQVYRPFKLKLHQFRTTQASS